MTQPPPELTLAGFARARRDGAPWVAGLVQREIGGGRTTTDDLQRLSEHPDAVALTVSGLDQAIFERLVIEHGRRYRAIELWKSPRITDLTPLQDLPDLELVTIYWNQRTTRLWDLGATPRLRALALQDFTRLHDLDDLRGGRALAELHLGDAVDGASVYDTLDPLAGLDSIRRLTLTPKAVTDGRIQPLAGLSALEELHTALNLFTTEQFAWLRARLGDHVTSDALAGVKRLTSPIGDRDTFLVGRRKPFLHSAVHAERIARHEKAFADLVASYRADPTLEPAPTR